MSSSPCPDEDAIIIELMEKIIQLVAEMSENAVKESDDTSANTIAAANFIAPISKLALSNDNRDNSNSPLGLIIADSPGSSSGSATNNLESDNSMFLNNEKGTSDAKNSVSPKPSDGNIVDESKSKSENHVNNNNDDGDSKFASLPIDDLPPKLEAECTPNEQEISETPCNKTDASVVSLAVSNSSKIQQMPTLVRSKVAKHNGPSFVKLIQKSGKKQLNLLPKPVQDTNGVVSQASLNSNLNSSILSSPSTTNVTTLISTSTSSPADQNGKELSKILPKKPQKVPQIKSLPTLLPALQKQTIKPTSCDGTSHSIDKSVKEVVADMSKASSTASSTFSHAPMTSSSLETTANTIDTVMTEVLQSAALSASKLSSGDGLSTLPPIKARKRAPPRQKNSNANKKAGTFDSQSSTGEQKPTTNNFLLPNMIFPNQLTMASGNLIAMPPGCMQQFVIQPTTLTNQQNGNNGLIPVMPSQPLFVTSALQKQQSQQQQQQQQNGKVVSNGVGTSTTASSIATTSSNSANVISTPLYFRLSSSNNGIIMPVSGTGTFRNNGTQAVSVSTVSSNNHLSSASTSSLKFIQPKVSTAVSSGDTRSILPNTSKNSATPLYSTSRIATSAASTSGQNSQQIFCLSNSQQSSPFLTASLNNQQLTQIRTIPIINGGSNGVNSSRLVQLNASSSLENNSNYAMLTTTNAVLQQPPPQLIPADFVARNGILPPSLEPIDKNYRAQSSINYTSAHPSNQSQWKDKNANNEKIPSILANDSLQPVHAENSMEEEENEPPPLLCRGEMISIQNCFLKEAELLRRHLFDAKGCPKVPTSTIQHFINNFVIEESADPFPCENSELLNEVGQFTSSINDDQNESVINNLGNNKNAGRSKYGTEKAEHSDSLGDGSDYEDDSNIGSRKRKFDDMSPKSSKCDDPPTRKRRGRRGGNCELKGLLMMDFGPGKTPFQTTSIERYTEEVILEARQQQRCLAFEKCLVKRSSETSSVTSGRNSPTTSGSKRGRKRTSGDQHAETSDYRYDDDKFEETNLQDQSLNEEQKQDEYHELWGDERCLCCQQKFRDLGRRHPEMPQYCSKACRKKSKKQQKFATCLNNMERTDLLSVGARTEMNVKNNDNKNDILKKSPAGDSSIYLSSEKSLSKPIQPMPCSPPSTPSALIALRRNVSSPSRTAASAFSLKIRTPQKVASTESDTLLCQPSTAVPTRLSSEWSVPVSSAPAGATQPIMAHVIGSTPGVMSFVPNTGQLPSMNNSIGNYPFYPFQQPQSFDPFYQQRLQQQQLQRKDSSSVILQPFHNQGMVFPIGATGASTISQSPPVLTPSGTPQTSQLHFIMQQQQNSTGSLNNSGGSDVSSPAPASITPTLAFSGEKSVEIQQLQTKGVQNWTIADVGRWANLVTNSESNSERFIQNEIDGAALIHLNTSLFQSELGLKLGPAVKLNNALNTLQKPSTPLYAQNPEIQMLAAHGVHNWTAEDVGLWANIVTNSKENGEKFVQQEIDGASLTLLKSQQFQNELDFKLGPALKLNAALVYLQA